MASSSSSLPAGNVFAIVKEYVDRMLPEDGSMKVLLLDDETMNIISVSYSQSALLKHGVFLIDSINNTTRLAMPTMRCVCFVRPSKESVAAVAAEVKAARYQNYSIAFSGTLSTEQLDVLARNDTSELVQRVEEYFADFITINNDFFTIPISTNTIANSLVSGKQGVRIAEGLANLCVAMRRKPHIRYQKNSEFAARIANEVVDVFKSDAELFDFKNRDSLLLVMDRNEDPVTSLLTPWTYQAMLHELVGMELNRMELPGAKAEDGYVFSQQDDSFFGANMFNNWGEICESVKAYVDQCKKTLNIDRETATIEEVKQFMQKLPQTKAMTGSVTKHATVVSHLSSVIKKRGLLDVSLLEQDMVQTTNQSEHFQRLQEIAAKSNTDPIDTLRLCLIFNLRYEKSGAGSKTDEVLMGTPYQSMVRRLRKYYGDRSTEPLFAASGMISSVVSFVKGMSEEGNIYTQHEPVIKKHLVALSQGKLNHEQFPYILPAAGLPGVFKPKEVILFMCGGCTFEEAALVHMINAGTGQKTSSGEVAKPIIGTDMKVVFGGTGIHNTRSFIDELEGF